jgi:transcriptional regulator with XRE-family HTH domain
MITLKTIFSQLAGGFIMLLSDIFKDATWNQRIKIIRIARNLTQKQAAEGIGTDIRIYQNWEKGRFKPRRLSRKAVANFFNLSENEIFNDMKVSR